MSNQFSLDAMKRIAAATRRVERSPSGVPSQLQRHGPPAPREFLVGRAYSTVAATTDPSSSVNSGLVTIWQWAQDSSKFEATSRTETAIDYRGVGWAANAWLHLHRLGHANGVIWLADPMSVGGECDCSQVSWSGAAADAHEIELVGTAYPEALTTLYQVDDDDDIGCGWTFTTGDTEDAGETGTFVQLNAPASQEDYSFTCRVSYRAVIRMAPTVPGDSTVVNCWPQWLASSGDPDGAGWATISNGGSICGISSPLGDDKYDALSHSFLWNGIDGDRIRFKLTRVGGEDGVPYTHENTFGTGNAAFVADIDFVNSYAT